MSNPLSKFGLTDMELDAEIIRNPAVIEGLRHLAGEVEEYWKGISPVFGDKPPKRAEPPYDEPGEYRDSIHTELTRSKEGKPTARVGTNDYKAYWIEFGSIRMPEYAPATKTAKYFGDTTGPVLSEGVQQAQGQLREELETLGKLEATGAAAKDIAGQKSRVTAARTARSAAFNAARGRRGRRR